MKNKISKYNLLVLFLLMPLIFSLFAKTAKAEYYNSYYNYSSTYPYQGNYGNYSNYPYYSNNNNLNYYNQSCPAGFTLGIQNGSYVCFQYLNQDYYGYNSINSNKEGCLSGYLFSPITGQRCTQYDYDYYLYKNIGEISNFDVREGDDTNLKEGDNDREIIKIRFNVLDEDIKLDRVLFDFEFRGNNYDEDLPWKVFDEAKLLLDGDVIEKIDTDTKSDWDEQGSDTYRLVFDNLNERIDEGHRSDLTLEIDVKSNLGGLNNTNTYWDVFVPNKGIRARNSNGENIYAGDDRDVVSIEIDQ